MKSTPHSSWTLYSWAFLFLMTLFQGLQWPLLPRFLDIYYHLSVMKGFEEAGGYVTRAYWEYAPQGRIHLYPPLLHIWMGMVHKLGLSSLSVGRLVDCVSYPALLAVWHLVLSRLYTPRIAFWGLVLFGSVYSAALASVTLSAFNLAFLLGLLALLNAEQKKPMWAASLLALCFYTHTLAAFLIAGILSLNLLFAAGKRMDHAKAILGGVLLGAPMLAYQFQFREFFAFVSPKENRRLELDLAIYGMLLLVPVFYPHLRKNTNLRWALCFWAGLTPLILTHQTRFFSGHGSAGAALLAALVLEEGLRRAEKRFEIPQVMAFCAAFFMFISLLSPHVEGNLKTGRKQLGWADRTLAHGLGMAPVRAQRPHSFTIFFQEPYEEIASVIRDHSETDDILWTDFSYTGGIFGLLTDRVTSSAMLAETKPLEQADRLTDARILVWFRDREGKPTLEMKKSVERRGLRLLKETDMVFVYENPQGYRKRQIEKPLIPWVFLWPLGLLSAGVVLAAVKRQRL